MPMRRRREPTRRRLQDPVSNRRPGSDAMTSKGLQDASNGTATSRIYKITKLVGVGFICIYRRCSFGALSTDAFARRARARASMMFKNAVVYEIAAVRNSCALLSRATGAQRNMPADHRSAEQTEVRRLRWPALCLHILNSGLFTLGLNCSLPAVSTLRPA